VLDREKRINATSLKSANRGLSNFREIWELTQLLFFEVDGSFLCCLGYTLGAMLMLWDLSVRLSVSTSAATGSTLDVSSAIRLVWTKAITSLILTMVWLRLAWILRILFSRVLRWNFEFIDYLTYVNRCFHRVKQALSCLESCCFKMSCCESYCIFCYDKRVAPHDAPH